MATKSKVDKKLNKKIQKKIDEVKRKKKTNSTLDTLVCSVFNEVDEVSITLGLKKNKMFVEVRAELPTDSAEKILEDLNSYKV